MVDNLRAVLTRAALPNRSSGAARHHLVTRQILAGDATRRRVSRRRSKAIARGSRARRKAEAGRPAPDANGDDNDTPPLGGRGTDND